MRARFALVVVCLVLCGCGQVAAPPGSATAQSRATRASGTSPSTSPNRAPTRPAPIPPSSGPSPVAAEVVIAFTHAYINWNARTVSADMRALAAQSVGQARSAMELAAGETAHDYELQQGGIANQGQIEAVAPLNGRDDQWVVVTREQTTAQASAAYQGLTPAWHVTVATVTELPSGRWVLSGWEPEN